MEDVEPPPPPPPVLQGDKKTQCLCVKKSVPKPRKSAKQMVKEYEDLTLPPPPQFRDGYIPVPVQEPVPAPRTDKPTHKIIKLDQALKGHAYDDIR